MPANAVVRARIDTSIKGQATVVLEAMGLTVSDAVRMLLTRVAHEKALPFEPLAASATTIAAMKEARRGGLRSHTSVKDLMADLNRSGYIKPTVIERNERILARRVAFLSMKFSAQSLTVCEEMDAAAGDARARAHEAG